MQTRHRIHGLIRYFAILLVTLLTLQCGKADEGISGEVDMRVIPETPKVFIGDTSDGDKTIKGPWFKFQVQIQNTSVYKLVIQSISIEIDGNIATTMLPNMLNYTIDEVGDCKYIYFGPFDGAATGFVPLSAVPSSGPAGCSTIVSVDYILGNNPNTGSKRYKVALKPIGWFYVDNGNPTDVSNPVENFEKTFYFYTK